ncbi:MAG: hypothetical protein IJU69_00035 [Bacteroidales bacterium]|nr:hypothetical protein [Bacteroidales bacterium]
MRIQEKFFGGRHRLLSACLLAVALACSCAGNPEPGRGVYFWKSTFELCDYELSFLRAHRVGLIYMKFFDVALERDWDNGGELAVVPVATVRFKSAIPEGIEVMPAVYITLDALRYYEGREDELSELITERIFAMTSYNEIPEIKQVQLDCDWTESTRDSYFRLCECTAERLRSRGASLSGTVRLHQLSQVRSFPFYFPTLMLYNTGSLRDSSTLNSILQVSEVKKYLRHRRKFKYMDFAFPAYSWGVLLRDGRYSGLLHISDFSDTALFAPSAEGRHILLRDTLIDGRLLRKGDVVRFESSDMEQIVLCRQLLDQRLLRSSGNNIIYHLDSASLSKFSYDEIESIYSR